ncbi:PREDICTED: protein ovarian tumor locus-like isoform X2 [Priapulus caudatus]|uniref:Protein ovarian tumor locus-like isoform X2 n=1 Tax=Priapulus caudatus TaxID=37621 RepID=A0ABM1DSF2_PRICU|nr:PREDICTED: protein ovarian tumor locus-like isoform X2 [Priapulus caudatus]
MGSRNAMDDYLSSLQLFRKTTAKDGSCLFRAVSEQLFDTQTCHASVRLACISYMERHREKFEPFIEGPFEWHITALKNPKTWAGQVELKALSCLYKRDFLVYKEIGQPPINATGNGFENKIFLCHSGNHYDSVCPKSNIESAAFCQAIVYEILYKGVFELGPEVGIAVDMVRNKGTSARCRRESTASVDSTCDRTDSPSPEPPSNTDSSELESSTEVKDRGAMARKEAEMRKAAMLHGPPLPYKVAKSLDPDHYRNVEFDVWLESVREQERQFELQMMTSEYLPGDKVLVHMDGKTYHAHVQEMSQDKGPVSVFIEETGRKCEVAYEQLEQCPFNTRPVPHWRGRGFRGLAAFPPLSRFAGRGRKKFFKKKYRESYPMPFSQLHPPLTSHRYQQHGLDMRPVYRNGFHQRGMPNNRWMGNRYMKPHWYSSPDPESRQFHYSRQRRHSAPSTCLDVNNHSPPSTSKSDGESTEKTLRDILGRAEQSPERPAASGNCEHSAPQPVPGQCTTSEATGNTSQVCPNNGGSSAPTCASAMAMPTASPLPQPVTYIPYVPAYVPYLVVPGVDVSTVNYNIGPSKDPAGSDLPLSDFGTLRFFYNLGFEYFRVSSMMQQQQQQQQQSAIVMPPPQQGMTYMYPATPAMGVTEDSSSPDEHGSRNEGSPNGYKQQDLLVGSLDMSGSTQDACSSGDATKPVYVQYLNNNYLYYTPEGIAVVTPQQQQQQQQQPEPGGYAMTEPYVNTGDTYVADMEKLSLGDVPREGAGEQDPAQHVYQQKSYQDRAYPCDERTADGGVAGRRTYDKVGPRFRKYNRGRGGSRCAARTTDRYDDFQEAPAVGGGYGGAVLGASTHYQPSSGNFYGSQPGNNTTTVYSNVPAAPYPSTGMMLSSTPPSSHPAQGHFPPGCGYYPVTPPSPNNPAPNFYYNPQYPSTACNGMSGYALPPPVCPPTMQPMV